MLGRGGVGECCRAIEFLPTDQSDIIKTEAKLSITMSDLLLLSLK